ncbi:MAG: histidinol dehydrogenase [Acidimicrobiia bacterium]|nr:histidinol dehydrogenase [Acidimicrobiia bacterium]
MALNRIDLRGASDLASLLPRPESRGDEPVEAVRDLIADVRLRGDTALVELTERFDGVRLDSIAVPPAALAAALERIAPELRAALETAAGNIEAFHRTQVRPDHTWEHEGLTVAGRSVPVDRAGLYVPGGRAAYPSTVLMTAIPARVAGVGQIALCVPPDRATGAVADVTLAAAAIAGVDEVYAVGGAQAIAAMAYGTESVAAVDVIAGPGNIFVAVAKREVAGDVGVAAAFAGPSEIVVVADDTTPATYAAIDLMVQAEHGPDGLSWLLTWSEDTVAAVDAEIDRLTAVAPRRAEIEATLAGNGWVGLVDGPEQAMAVANLIAPEHLQLMCAEPEKLVPLVRHAGAVFCGPLSPASFGDYLAGPSHVLPTHGSARFGGALGVDDFTKAVHVVTVAPDGFERFADAVETLAAAEGFDAHASSVRLRRAAVEGSTP